MGKRAGYDWVRGGHAELAAAHTGLDGWKEARAMLTAIMSAVRIALVRFRSQRSVAQELV